MKINFESIVIGRSQPDPYIFEDDGKFFMYVTANDGVEAYTADDVFGEWKFYGIVGSVPGGKNYWAPCIIKTGGMYYIYVSCDVDGCFEHLHVMRSDSPLGPFGDSKKLFDRFTIDAHAVETDAGLFLWYAEDNTVGDRIGTRVFLDRLIDPYTPANERREVIVPTHDEEIFKRKHVNGRDWHTIEGAFWFKEGDWQYLMYSGGCYQNDTYHIGYCTAKTDETDLTKVEFIKHTLDGGFDPVMIKNDFEEGVGHHSVIKLNGEYYAVYHGRDLRDEDDEGYVERRTARICKLHVCDGVITAERYPDHI